MEVEVLMVLRSHKKVTVVDETAVMWLVIQANGHLVHDLCHQDGMTSRLLGDYRLVVSLYARRTRLDEEAIYHLLDGYPHEQA